MLSNSGSTDESPEYVSLSEDFRADFGGASFNADKTYESSNSRITT